MAQEPEERGGDFASSPDSQRRLLQEIYADLKQIAHRLFQGERPGHTLQPTALLHEAVLRLLKEKKALPRERRHLLALSAHVMRHVLIEHARGRASVKRGGDALKIELREEDAMAGEARLDILCLHHLLERLQRIAPREHQIVELRFFGGFSIREIAEISQLGESTVRLELQKAKAWLQQKLREMPD